MKDNILIIQKEFNSRIEFTPYIIRLSPNNDFLVVIRGCLTLYKLEIWDFKKGNLLKIFESKKNIKNIVLTNYNLILCLDDCLESINLYNFEQKFILERKYIENIAISNDKTKIAIINNPYGEYKDSSNEDSDWLEVDGSIEIFDVNEFKLINRIIQNDDLTNLSFSPEDNFIFTIGKYSYPLQIKVYSLSLRELNKTIAWETEYISKEKIWWGYSETKEYYRIDGDYLTNIKFSNDGNFFGVSSNESLRIWDYKNYKKEITVRIDDIGICPSCGQGFSIEIDKFQFINNNKNIICFSSKSRCLYVIDLKTGETLNRLDYIMSDDFDVTYDNKFLISAGLNKNFSIKLPKININ